MKKCPYCAEDIQDEAIKCKHCGSMLAGPDDPVRSASSTGDGIRLEAARLLNTEGKIAAIKYIREKKGFGLAQAKVYVEAIGGGGNPDEAARSVPADRGGCAPVLLALIVAAAAFIWWWTRY